MPITKLKVNKKFNYVIQLADVHIRLTKRHDEYKEVFNRTFESIAKTPDDTAIFIVGDIVNSKLDLSPECVDLAAYFLFQLASLRPTVLIAGNHDTNLTNKNRMDSLSPIVDALRHPNLFYLKESGLYGFGNICINNYSVFDGPEKYLPGKDIPQIYRNEYEHFVVCYHGTVDGAITDIGFRLSNHAISINTFDNHDIVLMGDIHKLQDLQLRDDQTNKPAIRYCGSLIQQKHDETLNNHGYSFWNLQLKDYSHVEIPNDYGFYSVMLENGVITSNLSNIPKKTRLRFQLKNTMPTDIKKALSEVRKLTEVIDSCYQKLDTDIALARIQSTTGNVVLGNIHDISYQDSLLVDFLKNKLDITDQASIDAIIAINHDMNNDVKTDDLSRNIRWTPIKFEWENMFSYGEENVIDFTKTKGIVGLFAANTSGKSSIFSALSFCLFDKCEREYKAENIMNIQKTDFKCKFEFEIDGIHYFIERIADSDKKGKVKVDVRFWKLENGVKIDLNGEQRKDTNKLIREYIGSYEDFVLTSLSVQSGKNNISIIDMGDTDRKDLFAQFMGLNIFDELHTIANEKLRECIITLRNFKNEDYIKSLNDYTNFLSQATGLYEVESANLVILNEEKTGIQNEILEKTKKLIKIDVNIPPIDSLIITMNSAKSSLEKVKESVKSLELKIIETKSPLDDIEQNITEFEKKDVNSSYEKHQTLTNKSVTIQGQLDRLKVLIESGNQIINKSTSHEYDPNCSFCFKNAGKIVKDKEQAELNVKKYNETDFELKSSLIELMDEISKLEWSKKANSEYRLLLNNRNTIKDKHLLLVNNMNTQQGNINTFENKIKECQTHIDLYNANREAITFNDSIETSINELKQLLRNIEYNITKKNQLLLDINGKISICKNKISETNDFVNKVKLVEKQFKLYEAYCKAVSRDGIPFTVITATVPEIQNEVNNILSQTTDFTTIFETDGKNIIPYIVYDGLKWLMSLTSGFEKFALSLAIRVALINISNLPRPNFLVLDEGFGVLDAENLSSVSTLFSYLKTNFEFVLVISHLEPLRDVVDDHIEIAKENKFSKVSYI